MHRICIGARNILAGYTVDQFSNGDEFATANIYSGTGSPSSVSASGSVYYAPSQPEYNTALVNVYIGGESPFDGNPVPPIWNTISLNRASLVASYTYSQQNCMDAGFYYMVPYANWNRNRFQCTISDFVDAGNDM